MESATTDSNQKKDPFEHLSKEELIKKCKQFLGIAQKAKQAKDEIVEENKGLTQKIQQLDAEALKDMKAMQEMLNVLTQQKLQLVTDCDSLRTQNNKFKTNLLELTEFKTKVETFDIENQSYGRQVKRLVDENEQLLNHLEALEQQISELNSIGEQQRNQLLLLERQNITSDEINTNALNQNVYNESDNKELTEKLNESLLLIKQLETKCNTVENDLKNNELLLNEKNQTLGRVYEEIEDLKAKNKQIDQLKQFCQSKENEVDSLKTKLEMLNSSVIDDLNNQLENNKTLLLESENKSKNLTDELETTTKTKDQFNEKLKLYRSKLIKVFSDLKDLKQNKNQLLSIVDEYSKYIHQWQSEICKVSEYFQKELNKRDTELNNYKSQNIELLQTCDDLKEKLAVYKENRILINEEVLRKESESFNKELKQRRIEIEKYKTRINGLNKKCDDLKEKLSNYDANTLKELQNKEALIEEKQQLVLVINKITEENMTNKEQLVNELKTIQDKLDGVMEENTNLLTKSSNLENDLKQNNEIHSDLKQQIQSFQDSIASLTKENSKLLQEISIIKSTTDDNQELMNAKEKLKINEALEKENICVKNTNSELEQLKEKYIKENKVLTTENKELFDIIACNKFKTQLLDYYTTITKYIQIEDSDIGKEIQAKVDTLKSNLEKKNPLSQTVNSEDLRQNLKTIKDNLELENIALIKFLQEAYKKIIDNLRQQLKNNSSQGKDKDNLLKDKSNNINTLTEENTMLQNELTAYKRDITDLQNQLSISKRENVDLLKEMNDMNQALKERGETISKLQEYVQELIRKVKTMETETASSKEEKDKLEQELKILNTKAQVVPLKSADSALLGAKDEKIKTLELEIQSLREHQDVADSETMSTSTVSRLDDASRFRDLEGTWEERYTKLRALALKLKGKVKELTEQLNQERCEKTDIQNKYTTITKNLQSVQIEFDKYQDQYELINKEHKTTNKQIESLITENNKMKQDLKIRSDIVSKLKDEIENQRKEKIDMNSAMKLLHNQINNLKKDVDNGMTAKKDLENKIHKLEVHVKSKEDELQKELKVHKVTKEQLQKLEKEIKKKSVLSLEMEDSERSLRDMSQKLEKKNEQINKLEMKVISQNNNIVSIKEQNRLLEEKVSEAESHYQQIEAQLLEMKSKFTEAEATILQKEGQIKELVKTLECLKTTNENVNSELAHTVSQNQKQIEQLKFDKDHLKSQVLGLEEKVRDITKKLTDREQELSLVNTEFSSYKVRAQSVLRQNQVRDVAHEEKLTDEVSELKSEVEALTTQLNSITTQLQALTNKYETIEREKLQIQSQCRDFEKLLSKEKDANRILIERQQQLVTEHRETMRAQKIHADTLAQCYKQQLAEQEERHSKTITELQTAQISNTKSKSYDDHVDITSMRREDAEGSESVESNSNNQGSKMVPLSLDKLLKMDIDSFTSHNFEEELSQCKKQIIEHQAQVKHLTELLADAEQDLAKHAQLNTLLKEEIRRHQRSIEREKHVENLEYLKNVIFKFVTLASGDEKSHMVPVLNTILKLSPEETQKLNAVAKGDSSMRGWGSYLPTWNSPNNK